MVQLSYTPNRHTADTPDLPATGYRSDKMIQPAATIEQISKRLEVWYCSCHLWEVGPCHVLTLIMHLQEVTNALTATFSAQHGNRQDTVQRLALAREQFLETCTQLRDQLVSACNALAPHTPSEAYILACSCCQPKA
jgi:hypothetical protein